MKIKVCGIRTKANLAFLEASAVDYIGFIFYAASKRNFGDGDLDQSDLIACTKKKVGVFVNESLEELEEIGRKFNFDVIQLHGDESPEFCQSVRSLGFEVWKAFSIGEVLPGHLIDYDQSVDCYLFDTKGKNYGGNGQHFDWSVLDAYQFSKPFLLSGGVCEEDVKKIVRLGYSQLLGVDINSKFEFAPGVKDEESIERFAKEIRGAIG
jgi:phosphoribosylanthranilate isomerase